MSKSTEKKIIAIVGATGAQGGGLVRAILAHPERGFAARAITRDPHGEKARALAQAGAEVVAADLDDVASLERAFAGAHGAFCVTPFWAHMSTEREKQQAENMARAAKKAGVAHVIWSTLDDSRRQIPLEDTRMPTLAGHYKVPHYDAKAEANQSFAALGVPTTFLLTSFYWDNFIHFGMGPRRAPDGSLVLALPLGKAALPGIASEDIGACALGIFARGAETIGKRIGIAGEHATGERMAQVLGAVIGEKVTFVDLPPDAYRALGFPGADDLGNMFQWQRDFEKEYRAPRSVERTRELHPGLLDFERWARAHAAEIAVPRPDAA